MTDDRVAMKSGPRTKPENLHLNHGYWVRHYWRKLRWKLALWVLPVKTTDKMVIYPEGDEYVR